jgi:hypothetical protein
VRPILAGVSRHAGRGRIFLGVVTALVTAVVVAPALSGDEGAQTAQKVDFFPGGFSCNPPGTGTPDKSFAIINRKRDGGVSARVVLRDLQPNTEYRVWLVDSGCGADTYRVRTNDQGNETLDIDSAVNTNAASVAVTGPGGDMQTPTVTFGRDDGAPKVDFFPGAFSCNPPGTGTPDKSFAIVYRNPDGGVSAQVVLRDLQPNTNYRVWLVDSDCGADTYQVRTNNQGNETVLIDSAVNTNAASVAVTGPGPDMQTPTVTFGG